LGRLENYPSTLVVGTGTGHDVPVTARPPIDARRGELPVHLSLPGEIELVVRAIEPDDVPAVTALHERLSPEAVYRRFFTSVLPPPSFFERLATVAERGGLGLVAEVVGAPDDDRLGIVGEVDIEPLRNGNGEIAVVVDARWRGWLGPYLVELACRAARRRGIANLEAEVLTCNRQMRALTRSRGEAFLPASDWQEVRVVFSTAGPVPSWLPGDRPRILVEQRGVAFDAVAGLEAAGFDVLACAGRTAGRPACPVLAGDTCPLAAGADAIVVAMAPSDERDELVAAHRAGAVPVVVVEPGTTPITAAALVDAAREALAAGASAE
jgi:RimJ/RimL family protein N-acetyltransferase